MPVSTWTEEELRFLHILHVEFKDFKQAELVALFMHLFPNCQHSTSGPTLRTAWVARHYDGRNNNGWSVAAPNSRRKTGYTDAEHAVALAARNKLVSGAAALGITLTPSGDPDVGNTPCDCKICQPGLPKNQKPAAAPRPRQRKDDSAPTRKRKAYKMEAADTEDDEPDEVDEDAEMEDQALEDSSVVDSNEGGDQLSDDIEMPDHEQDRQPQGRRPYRSVRNTGKHPVVGGTSQQEAFAEDDDHDEANITPEEDAQLQGDKEDWQPRSILPASRSRFTMRGPHRQVNAYGRIGDTDDDDSVNKIDGPSRNLPTTRRGRPSLRVRRPRSANTTQHNVEDDNATASNENHQGSDMDVDAPRSILPARIGRGQRKLFGGSFPGGLASDVDDGEKAQVDDTTPRPTRKQPSRVAPPKVRPPKIGDRPQKRLTPYQNTKKGKAWQSRAITQRFAPAPPIISEFQELKLGLQMLHGGDLTFEPTRVYAEPVINKWDPTPFINPTSTAFKKGGLVLQVLLAGSFKTVMMCNTAHCRPCGAQVAKFPKHETGLPFVHRRQCVTDAKHGYLVFDPQDAAEESAQRKDRQATSTEDVAINCGSEERHKWEKISCDVCVLTSCRHYQRREVIGAPR